MIEVSQFCELFGLCGNDDDLLVAFLNVILRDLVAEKMAASEQLKINK